jgi:hypothetical protein
VHRFVALRDDKKPREVRRDSEISVLFTTSRIMVFTGFPKAIDVEVDFRRSGLAFVIKTDDLVSKIVAARVTLLLRWAEVAVIIGIVAAAWLAIAFRLEIARTPLIASWAPQHKTEAALTVGVLTMITGCILAFWKKRQLFVYGIWEIVFGTFSAFQTALVLWPNGEIGKFVALASALYVVSRGAGNVSDAYQKEKQIERLKLELKAGKVLNPTNYPNFYPFTSS